MTELEFYHVRGGSGDGKILNKRYLPELDEGEMVWVKSDQVDFGEQYRLKGDKLVYMQRDSIKYTGGPCDGSMCQEDETIPDGENAVVPLLDGRYAWYYRIGDRMRFSHILTYGELELIVAENA